MKYFALIVLFGLAIQSEEAVTEEVVTDDAEQTPEELE